MIDWKGRVRFIDNKHRFVFSAPTRRAVPCHCPP